MLPPGYWKYRVRRVPDPAGPETGKTEGRGEKESKEDWGGDSHPGKGQAMERRTAGSEAR